MPNTNGYTGLVVSQNSDDNVTICGLDPNSNPSCIVDPCGRSRKEKCMSGTQGTLTLPSSYSEVKAVDNSGDHEGGAYSVVAMNKFNVDAGGGGINLNSSGNITLMGLGGIVNVVAHSQVELFSKIVKIDSTEITIINGTTLDINSKVINCNNLTKINNNAVVEGSLMVGGELYTTHITGMGDMYQTLPYSSMTVFLNPNLKFKGIFKMSNLIPSGPYMPNSAIVDMDLLLLDPVTATSKAGWTEPHQHDFYHLAADLKNIQSDVWSEAEQIENAESALPAKKPDNFVKTITNMVTDKVTSAIKSVIKNSIGF